MFYFSHPISHFTIPLSHESSFKTLQTSINHFHTRHQMPTTNWMLLSSNNFHLAVLEIWNMILLNTFITTHTQIPLKRKHWQSGSCFGTLSYRPNGFFRVFWKESGCSRITVSPFNLPCKSSNCPVRQALLIYPPKEEKKLRTE